MAEDIIAKLADGTELHFPAGTSDAVVDKVVQSHVQGNAQPSAPYQMTEEDKARIASMIAGGNPSLQSAKYSVGVPKTTAENYPLTTAYGVGLAKPIAGAAQWAGVNEPAKFLKGQEELARSTGRTGVGASEFGGEMGSLLLGSRLLPKTNLLPKNISELVQKSPLLKNVAIGAGTSAIMPTDTNGSYEDFLANKAGDIGTGGALGGVFGKATQALLSPEVSAGVKKMIESGQKYFTPAQLFSETPVIGKTLQTAEQALTSLPLTGSLISGSLQRSVNNFNKNIANSVLKPLGEKLDPSMEAGHKMIDYVHNKVSGAYDDIASKLKFDATHVNPNTQQSTMKNLTDKLQSVTDELNPEDTTKIHGIFNKFIIDPLNKDLNLAGEKFRSAESKLGKEAYNAYKKGDYAISNALRDLQDGLRGELASQNPKYAERLSNIHDSFKKYLRLERAGSYRGADEGVFSPAQFRSAVESIGGKKQTARGRAMMQDYANTAESVLGKKLPDSGTAARLLNPAWLASKMGTGAVEGGINKLFGFIPLAVAGGIYNPISQRAITKLMTERPDLLRELAPYLSNAAAVAGGSNQQGLLGQ